MRTSLFSSGLRSLTTFAISILCFGLLSTSTASAATQVVNCGTSGTFTITDNVLVSNSSCVGSVTIPNTVTRTSATPTPRPSVTPTAKATPKPSSKPTIAAAPKTTVSTNKTKVAVTGLKPGQKIKVTIKVKN